MWVIYWIFEYCYEQVFAVLIIYFDSNILWFHILWKTFRKKFRFYQCFSYNIGKKNTSLYMELSESKLEFELFTKVITSSQPGQFTPVGKWKYTFRPIIGILKLFMKFKVDLPFSLL